MKNATDFERDSTADIKSHLKTLNLPVAGARIECIERLVEEFNGGGKNDSHPYA